MTGSDRGGSPSRASSISNVIVEFSDFSSKSSKISLPPTKQSYSFPCFCYFEEVYIVYFNLFKINLKFQLNFP